MSICCVFSASCTFFYTRTLCLSRCYSIRFVLDLCCHAILYLFCRLSETFCENVVISKIIDVGGSARGGGVGRGHEDRRVEQRMIQELSCRRTVRWGQREELVQQVAELAMGSEGREEG